MTTASTASSSVTGSGESAASGTHVTELGSTQSAGSPGGTATRLAPYRCSAASTALATPSAGTRSTVAR